MEKFITKVAPVKFICISLSRFSTRRVCKWAVVILLGLHDYWIDFRLIKAGSGKVQKNVFFFI